MRISILLSILLFSLIAASNTRVRRAAYDLPDGVELIIGNYRTTFSCDGLNYGYYADVDNDCRLFHICQTVELADGTLQNNHWSFLCGNQTVFDQISLTCNHPEDAVPCENARDFYYVNDNFGIPDAQFLRDDDLDRANQIIGSRFGDRRGK